MSHLCPIAAHSARRAWLLALLLALPCILQLPWTAPSLGADDAPNPPAALVAALRTVATDQLDQPGSQMLREHLRRTVQEANQRSTRQWREITTRDQWEAFRDEKLDSLRQSLGRFPDPPKQIASHVTARHEGPGYVLENVLFESRPGLWVTANRYLPADMPDENEKESRKQMPGILICHAHHTPKEHRELQHMGMTWARRGAVVLVMDQMGHGERRQHPFRSSEDYAGSFRVSRQDYFFRYDNGIQLHLAGQSLIGQFAWDLQRGVDLLLGQPGVDPERIALLGAVAGGGDPAAVAAALDRRIGLVVPFNFGGPQPETRFPLPEDADDQFNYAGGGSWESTRNLYQSARDGFLPWVIVGSIAPRKLIYAHEFSWDRERDPVWRRLRQLYTLYGQGEDVEGAIEGALDWTHGFGSVRGQAPDSSHCTHIGPVQRKRIHAALQRWFQLDGADQPEFLEDRPADELTCLTDEARKQLQPQPLHQVLLRQVDQRLTEVREQVDRISPQDRRKWLGTKWSKALGPITPVSTTVARLAQPTRLDSTETTVHGVVLQVDTDVLLPLVLLVPTLSATQAPATQAPATQAPATQAPATQAPATQNKSDQKPPVVVAFSQAGKQQLLRARASDVAALLASGVAVCLPDLRGIGETRPDDGRERQSSATSLSSTALMVDGPLLGQRMRDLRCVLEYLRQRPDVDAGRLALWGDSLAEPNPADSPFQAPRGIDGRPRQGEPLGGLLALLTPLYEPDVRAVYWHGGLSGYRSVLESPFVYIPHDAVVAGALDQGDLCDVAAGLAPLPLMASGVVDGWNRRLDEVTVRRVYAPAWNRYKELDAARNLNLVSSSTRPAVAAWLIQQLK